MVGDVVTAAEVKGLQNRYSADYIPDGSFHGEDLNFSNAAPDEGGVDEGQRSTQMETSLDSFPNAFCVGSVAPYGADLGGSAFLADRKSFEDHGEDFGEQVADVCSFGWWRRERWRLGSCWYPRRWLEVEWHWSEMVLAVRGVGGESMVVGWPMGDESRRR